MIEFAELKEHLINLSFEFEDIWVVNDDLVNMEWNVRTRNYRNKKSDFNFAIEELSNIDSEYFFEFKNSIHFYLEIEL